MTEPADELLDARVLGTSGPRVVLVHGGPGAPGSMRAVADELAQTCRVLEPDQRASGGAPLTVARHVEDLRAFIKARCEGERPVVIGHSWGAMLALAYAAAVPDGPRSLVLVGCGTFDSEARAAMQAARDARLGTAGAAHLARLARDIADPDERLAAMGGFLMRQDACDPIEGALDVGRCDARANAETWADMLRLQEADVFPQAFAAIRVPVLMLHGARDSHPGELTRDGLRRWIPHLRYREWARCGHVPWVERDVRAAFYDAVRQWIDHADTSRVCTAVEQP